MSIFDTPQGDKRTLIAIVLSVIVITAGFMIQNVLFPPTTPVVVQPTAAPAPAQGNSPATVPSTPASNVKAAEAPSASTHVAGKVNSTASGTATLLQIDAPVAERKYTVSTDLLEAIFSNKGGDLVSLKLKKHRDRDGAVDLIVPKNDGVQGLSVAFGAPGSAPLQDLMNGRMIDDRTIEFSRTFLATVPGKTEPIPFVLRKSFTFRNGEYLFSLAVTLENSVNEYIPLDQGGYAYTLTIGPQIGPQLSTVSKNANSDFRKFITLTGSKKREEKVTAGVPFSPKDQASWAAISGKYFTFIAIPEIASFGVTMRTAPDPVLFQTNSLAISRPSIKASKQTDAYYFFFGPKTSAELAKYDYPDRNAFLRSGLKLEEAMDNSNILGWLESILKFCLNMFYKLIPNYGIAIILVTILVKVLFFPLTRKGSIASARMQELQPKMQEIQAKFKGNPQKMNQEMAEFYKREGYNPMSGCLPLLIQFPLFIAMYNLFNNHFDLRGASFIPGWIFDLSQPEAIFSFSTINLVIWQVSALRLLPVIYLGSQLLYGKFTSTSAPGQSATQMKIMMYGMPIFFFFILYDVPSGLLIYWISTNILSIVQQVVINDFLKKRKAAAVTATVIETPVKKKK